MRVSEIRVKQIRVNQGLGVLFWVLVIGFLNLVSVDAKERSKVSQVEFSVSDQCA